MKTIVLIHGWNYHNYTKFGCIDAWHNRSGFVGKLKKHFNVVNLNLPGFCGEKEPETDEGWDLFNFAKFFQNFLEKNNINPDYVLGYSFGGAVAVIWKSMFQNDTKLILVSPAIKRKYSSKNISIGFLRGIIPGNIINFVRDLYLKYLVKNQFYVHGTSFLRNTYRNIVSVDLRDKLVSLNPQGFVCIFGEDDVTTPPAFLINNINNKSILERIFVIKGGGHNIANTHTEELVDLILLNKGN